MARFTERATAERREHCAISVLCTAKQHLIILLVDFFFYINAMFLHVQARLDRLCLLCGRESLMCVVAC